MGNKECDELYGDILKNKVVDAKELISMIKAQSKGESEDIKIFAERIIDLIYSHANTR